MIKCTFLGDIMCKAELIDAFDNNNKYDFSPMFAKMKNIFSQSDFVMGNLETPISFDNSGLTDETFRFNSPHEFAEAVKDSGINAVATANNHCLDRGIGGVYSTVKSLDQIGLIHTGCLSQDRDSAVVTVGKNLKLGLLSYTYGTNAFSNHEYLSFKERKSVNLFQNQELSNPIDRYCYNHQSHLLCRVYNKMIKCIWPEQFTRPVYEHREFDFLKKRDLRKQIQKIKKQGADIVIMYMHAGGQYNDSPTTYTKELANWLIKNGVDIVVGSHEHVVHGGDFSCKNQGKLITYSLGNFDGIAGVYAQPMDKMAEYSIAWHIYFNEEKKNPVIAKTSYSVLKCIETQNKQIQTVPVYDLLMDSKISEEKVQLWKDMQQIAQTFSGTSISDIGPKEEYEI